MLKLCETISVSLGSTLKYICMYPSMMELKHAVDDVHHAVARAVVL